MLQPNRGQRRTLQPSVTLNLEIHKAEKSWRFAVCQVHVKQYKVTLSLNPKFSYDSSDKGPNVAVLFPFPYTIKNYPFYLRSESKEESFQADIIAVPYINGGKVAFNAVYIFLINTFNSPKICENNYIIVICLTGNFLKVILPLCLRNSDHQECLLFFNVTCLFDLTIIIWHLFQIIIIAL